MRHKYETRAIVLSRVPVGEANASLTLLTRDFDIIYVRAQSVRRSGAKLAAALATFAESEVTLVRGRDQWRITGAVLQENWFSRMQPLARARAARVSGLLLRIAGGESGESNLFVVMRSLFDALATLSEESHEAAETLAVLRFLSMLGLDAGEIPGAVTDYTPSVLACIASNRPGYVSRINRGIEASGL